MNGLIKNLNESVICDSTAQNESHVPLESTEHATHFVQLSHIYE